MSDVRYDSGPGEVEPHFVSDDEIIEIRSEFALDCSAASEGNCDLEASCDPGVLKLGREANAARVAMPIAEKFAYDRIRRITDDWMDDKITFKARGDEITKVRREFYISQNLLSYKYTQIIEKSLNEYIAIRNACLARPPKISTGTIFTGTPAVPG